MGWIAEGVVNREDAKRPIPWGYDHTSRREHNL